MENTERTHYYFRIKTECKVEKPNMELGKKKIEELVYATSYTEAEIMAHELIASLNRSQFGDAIYEIIRTKIDDVLYNSVLVSEGNFPNGFSYNYFEEPETSGVGLYAVSVVYVTIDEKTAREKTTTEVFYVPAKSNSDATERINQHLKDCPTEFIIRDTKFDKVEAIYWPIDVLKAKIEAINK